MIDAPACPPAPAASAHADLLTFSVAPATALYRIFRGTNPVRFSRTRSANRFDPLPDPWQDTQVLYAGSTPEVAISETVLRWHDGFVGGAPLILERSRIEARQLIQLRPRCALSVIDLTGFALARIAPFAVPAAPDQLFLAPGAAARIESYCAGATAQATSRETEILARCRGDEVAAWRRLVLQNEFPSLTPAIRETCTSPPFPQSFVAEEVCARYETNSDVAR